MIVGWIEGDGASDRYGVRLRTTNEEITFRYENMTRQELDEFLKSLRKQFDELTEYFDELRDEMVEVGLDPKQTCPQCGAMHFSLTYGGCCGPTCWAIIKGEC